MVRGLGFWKLDFSVAKTTALSERLGLTLNFDFFNLFNHPHFNDPSLSILEPPGFGVITSQVTGNFTGPRRIQIGLRLEF